MTHSIKAALLVTHKEYEVFCVGSIAGATRTAKFPTSVSETDQIIFRKIYDNAAESYILDDKKINGITKR